VELGIKKYTPNNGKNGPAMATPIVFLILSLRVCARYIFISSLIVNVRLQKPNNAPKDEVNPIYKRNGLLRNMILMIVDDNSWRVYDVVRLGGEVKLGVMHQTIIFMFYFF
jgi:hypothetical protein